MLCYIIIIISSKCGESTTLSPLHHLAQLYSILRFVLVQQAVMDGDKLQELSSHITVPFHTSREAKIAYNTLRVDKEPPRGGCKKTLTLKGSNYQSHNPRACYKVNLQYYHPIYNLRLRSTININTYLKPT